MKNEKIETFCAKVNQTLAMRKAFVQGYMEGEARIGLDIKFDAMAKAEEKYPMPVFDEGEGELPEIAEARRIPEPEERKGEYTSIIEADQVF